jgi:putative oxidoreductase
MKNKLLDLGLLWLRIALGIGAIHHGWMKVVGEGSVVGWSERSVAAIGFPAPLLFALLALGGEIIGGFLLILGLWTRWAAAWGTIVWLVAAFGRHQGASFRFSELALAYAIVGISVIIMGPGRYAVDGGKGGGRASSAKKQK